MSEQIKALKTLYFDADKIFARIRGDLERGLVKEARTHLNFVDSMLGDESVTISGVIVLAGTDAETGKPRLVIETTEEQLRNVRPNIMFKKCEVKLL